jgi:hypothetical protein
MESVGTKGSVNDELRIKNEKQRRGGKPPDYHFGPLPRQGRPSSVEVCPSKKL